MKATIIMTGNRKKNIFWGILLLLAAAAFLIGKLDFFEGVGFWSIIFTIVLVGTLINGIRKGSFGEILFSLAFLIIVNDELLKLEAITPWPVLLAALFGTIGLNLLFPRFGKSMKFRRLEKKNESVWTEKRGMICVERRSENVVTYENVFGSAVKYITGEVSCVKLENAFGSLDVYFNGAILRDHSADVYLDASFGKVTLYVPADWNVVENAERSFANTTVEQGSDIPREDTLFVKGEVAFGELEICRI